MMKYDKMDLVKKEINPLIDKAYEICEKNEIPFFSFVMAAADEDERSTDWVSTRHIPRSIVGPETPIPDSLWAIMNLSARISEG